MMTPPPMRCGPAGWSYPHWDGLVYPKARPRNFHPLEYLAGYFDVVEINTTFYQPLRPEVSRLWMKKVSANPAFQFTAKLGRRFTHERILADGEVAAFKEGLWPLLRAGKLGCLLMQFPWSFRYTEENREFFIRLRRAFHEFPLVAEMRHSSWMLDEALGTFIDYRVGFCNIDQPEHTRAMPPTAFLTSAIAYIRLHGRNAAGGWLQEFDRSYERRRSPEYLYSTNQLEEWAARTEKIRQLAKATYIVANNDAAGKSVVNALQMSRILGEAQSHAPAGLVRRYPLELAGFRADRPVQECLFETEHRAVA